MSIVTNYYDNLRLCTNQSIECVENLAAAQNLTFDYIYLSNAPEFSENGCCRELVNSLQQSPNYALVYQNNSVHIYKKRWILL